MRMLERKRVKKTYAVVPGDEDVDLELGEGIGAQESGVTGTSAVEEAVDNWDENVEDAWDEDLEEHDIGSGSGEGVKTPSASSAGDVEETKKGGK